MNSKEMKTSIMSKLKRILSISAGLSLFLLLYGISTLLGILTDKQEDARQYYMEAGNVGIDLMVDNGSDDAIEIQPNAVTPLSINVTNVGTKDCYVFIKLMCLSNWSSPNCPAILYCLSPLPGIGRWLRTECTNTRWTV